MPKLHFPLFLLLLLSLATPALGQGNPGDPLMQLLQKEYKPDEPLIRPNVAKEAAYRDGSKPQAGIIDFVENEAYVIHADAPGVAYKAQKSKPVSIEDTLVCEEGARLIVLLKDQSQLSLGPNSQAVLDKVIYDPDTGARDTLVKQTAGAARYVVSKALTPGQSNFQVETPLAVMGVRGSDFAVALVPESEVAGLRTSLLERLLAPREAQAAPPRATVVVTGPDTTLQFRGTSGPSVTMTSFHSSFSVGGRPPVPPMPLTPGLVPGLLNRVGPRVSVMSMPTVFE